MSFQKRVREVYREQCGTDPDFVRIDCAASDGAMLPPDDIFSMVRSAADKVIFPVSR